MDINPEILLKLLSVSDQDKLRSLLSVYPDVTVLQFVSEYTDSIKPIRSSGYIKSIKITFNQLLKYTGNIPIQRFTKRTCESFILETYKKSPAAAALYFRTLKAAFNKAKLWNYVSDNPFCGFKLPREQRKIPAYIDINQLNVITQQTKNKTLKDLFIFAFFTGLRAGEIISLTWNNINLRERIIQVGDNNFKTKTRSIRFVPITEPVFNILSNRLPKIINSKKCYVFGKTSTIQFRGDYLSKKFKQSCRAAGLTEEVHFHSLRHSAASYLVQQGVPIYTVKDILGHTSTKTTEIYSHLNMTSLHQAMSCFNSITSQVVNS